MSLEISVDASYFTVIYFPAPRRCFSGFYEVTIVARILQWGVGEVENDITFDYTLYTGADPESFGEVDVILNRFKC